ncbi:MAG: hypothetical protein JW703_01105 [Candidatus Diapherotrites archaeon]|nr:hypothetical protein [Candidatus Diapherotrites archaeon]
MPRIKRIRPNEERQAWEAIQKHKLEISGKNRQVVQCSMNKTFRNKNKEWIQLHPTEAKQILKNVQVSHSISSKGMKIMEKHEGLLESLRVKNKEERIEKLSDYLYLNKEKEEIGALKEIIKAWHPTEYNDILRKFMAKLRN